MSARPSPRWFDTDGSGRPILSSYALDRTQRAVEQLRELPTVLGEVCLEDGLAVRAAAALSLGTPAGDAQFAAVFREARDAYVDQLVELRQLPDDDMSECEAAERLVAVYS